MAVDLQIEELEPTDRLEILRDRMRAAPVPLELRPLQPLDVQAKTRVADFGRVHLLSTGARGAWVCRTARLTRDETVPQIVISVLERGSTAVASEQGIVNVQPNEVVVNSTLVPYAVAFTGTTRHTFSVAYSDLGLPDAVLQSALGRPLGPAHPLAPVVAAYLNHLARLPDLAEPERQALEAPTVALVRALLATTAGDEFRARRPLAETITERVLQHIRMHYSEASLTPARVAAEHGISVRYLYRLLADRGVSFSGLLSDLRLDASARMLTAVPPTVRISVVARHHGYVNQAHFSRVFRDRFGCTPSEWRRQRGAVRDRGGGHDEASPPGA